MLSRQGKDIGDSHSVIVITGVCGNSYIIHVNADGSTKKFMLSYNGAKNVVHHCLEGGWGVSKAKEHECWFIEAVASFEGSFVFVTLLDADVVISPMDVQFSIDVGASQICDKVHDKGKWVLVSYSAVIDASIILDWA